MGWTERAIYGAQGELGEARDDGGGARTYQARSRRAGNLQQHKAIHRYMVSSNVGEVICVFVAALIGFPETFFCQSSCCG